MIKRILVAATISIFAASAAAQEGNEDHFTDTTLADMHLYAQLFWDYLDTGEVSEAGLAFEWTRPNEIGAEFDPMLFYLPLFAEVYSHRLPNYPSSNALSVLELVLNDPVLAPRFVEYTTTGVFRTPIDEDAQATAKHIAIAMAAEDEEEGFWLRGSWSAFENGMVVSNGLYPFRAIKPPPEGSIPPPPDPQDSLLVKEIKKLKRRGFYNPPSKDDGLIFVGEPGLDCDDHADMLAALMLNRLRDQFPELTVQLVWITWYGAGHVILFVCNGEECWYVDPGTGKLLPGNATLDDIIEWFKVIGYVNPERDPWLKGRSFMEPNARPAIEPAPWHTSEDRREDIEGWLNDPSIYPDGPPYELEDYIWDEFP